MKVFLQKQQTELFSNNKEPDLCLLFPILEEIKEQQSSQMSSSYYLDKLDKLFNIIINVSLLHNQIFNTLKEPTSAHELAYNLQLNRMNIENSLIDFFTNTTLPCKNHGMSKSSIKLTEGLRRTYMNTSTGHIHFKDNHQHDLILSKIKKQMDIDKKQYLCVNRSLHSNSQVNIKVANEKKIALLQEQEKLRMQLEQPINKTSNSNGKVKENKTKKNTPQNTIKKSNYYCSSIQCDKYKTPFKTEGKLFSSKNSLCWNYETYKGLETKPDETIVNYQDLGKPSNYAKYLLKKYKDVVDTYGEELKQSYTTLTTTNMKRSISSGKKDYLSPSRDIEFDQESKIQQQNPKVNFIRISKMQHKK